MAAGLCHGLPVVIPIHYRRTWAQPGTALTAPFHLMEWGINTGNKWPLLDANSLFTSGCSCSGETLQQGELNGTPYISGMEMCTLKRRCSLIFPPKWCWFDLFQRTEVMEVEKSP